MSVSGKSALPIATIVSACNSATTIGSSTNGRAWFDQNTSEGGGYSHIMTPNKPACQHSGTSSKYHTGIGASSLHPGGVNVGFLDGSVKFIKDSVSQTAWWAIATYGGGEVVSADSY